MSMKRCFELSVSSSSSLVGRAMLVGSVLSFAAACAHQGRREDRQHGYASADSATSAMPRLRLRLRVESVSTGETTVSAESKANPSVAATMCMRRSEHAAKDAMSRTTTRPLHDSPPRHRHIARCITRTAPRRRTLLLPHRRLRPHRLPRRRPAATCTARTAAADTGQKTGADTSKKTAAAEVAPINLLVSPQEYEGWKMFSRRTAIAAMASTPWAAASRRTSVTRVSSEGSVTHEVFITDRHERPSRQGHADVEGAAVRRSRSRDLWLYINARSSGRLAPGRPHMASDANPRNRNGRGELQRGRPENRVALFASRDRERAT